MADVKITALAVLTAADPINDAIPIVDVSDISMAASGTTKRISVNNILGASGTATLASATITGAATVGTTLGVTGVSTFAAGTALLPALTTTGDTNTGIYYPAADTFAVTTGGTERYRVDSSGNVGIKITPSAWASGATALQISSFVHIAQQSNGSSNVGFSCYESSTNAFTYSTGDAPTLYSQLNGQHKFYTAVAGTAGNPISFGNPKMTLNSVGNLTLDAGNLIMGTSGKGIDFSAVTGGTGTATANVLNDYEEGTWTGTLTGATTDPTIAVTATGRYTKVGRSVTVQIAFSNVITTGASGRIQVFGLPFTNNGTSASCAPVLLYSMGTFTGSPIANLGVNESFLGLFSSITNAASADVTHNAGTTRFLTVSITYTV